LSGALKVLGHHLRLYGRVWKGSVFVSFVSPVLYLASIGVGLGSLVSRGSAHTIGGVSYAAFIAPGLLAATAMMTASSETTFPIMARVYWMRTYDAMLASPLTVRDLVAGEVLWLSFRLAMVSVIFFLVMAAFQTVHSVEAVFAVPVAILSGLAFGTPVMAWAAKQRTDTPFALLYRFVVMPLFVLGGTFFPIDRLPRVVEGVAWLTPLAHGVALSRALTTGNAALSAAFVHVVVLAAYAAVGIAVAMVTFRQELAR
jgi:lipooligosaccharide transport system permease protein